MNRIPCAALALAVLALAGCGDPPVSTDTTYDPKLDPLVNPPRMLEPAPADGKGVAEDEWLYSTLNGNPDTLNPIFSSSEYESMVNGLLFDGPFTFNAKMEWMENPVWVDKLEESPDHKIWTLRLKPGLKWHDGVPVTAADIAFSWKQILDENVPCPAQKSGTDEIELCEAVDDLTVRFVHKTPQPTSKWNVLFSIIPKHLFEAGLAADPTMKNSPAFAKLNREPVGSGPYRFVEWKENDRIVLERWDDYPGPKPHFKRIVFRIIPDQNVQLLTFEKGETDETRLSSKQFAVETTNSAGFRKVGHKGLAQQWSFAYIVWNQDGSNPFFGDTRVRRAMTHAVNIPLMIRKLTYNLYVPCHGIFHPDSWMYNPEMKLLEFDLKKSAALLEEAGWAVSPEDGWRHKDGVKFSFTILIPSGSATGVDMAAIIQQDLKSIGVEMKTQTMEWATFSERTRKHEFQAATAAWGTGTDPDTNWNIWHSESYKDGRNYGGFKSARVDELFLLARNEFDHARRAGYYREIQKIVYDEQPYTFLWNVPVLWAFNNRLRGITYSPRGVWGFDPSSNAWWVHKDQQMYNLK